MSLLDRVRELIAVSQDLEDAILNMDCDDSMSAYTTYKLCADKLKEVSEFIKEL